VKLAKIEEPKTRVFMPTGLFTFAISLCLFAHVSAALHRLWGIAEAAVRVGFSRWDGNYDTFVRMHRRRGITHAGDCKRFDSSLFAHILWRVGKILVNWAGRSFARYEVIRRMMACAVYDDAGRVWYKFGGNSSGHLLTSDSNSIGRFGMHIYVILRWNEEYGGVVVDEEFITSRFTCSVFGDDDLFSFDEDESIGLTRETMSAANITRWMAEIGVTWVAEDEPQRFGTGQSFLKDEPVLYGGVWMPRPTDPGKAFWGLVFASYPQEVEEKTLLDSCEAFLLNNPMNHEEFGYMRQVMQRLAPRGHRVPTHAHCVSRYMAARTSRATWCEPG
jgi:hypothetical protein